MAISSLLRAATSASIPSNPGRTGLDQIARRGVARILLSNRNHVRAANEIRGRTGARTAIHPDDAGHAREQGGEIDDALHSDERVGPFFVVAMPGKSPGEVAFHWPERRLLVVGDAVIGHPPGQCGLLREAVLDDPDRLKQSVRRLLDIDFDTLLMGDAEPILEGANGTHKRSCGHVRSLRQVRRSVILIPGALSVVNAVTILHMAAQDLPASPFAALAESQGEVLVRPITTAALDRILEEHRRYLDTDRKQGARAKLSATDLTGKSFARLNLRRARLDHARARGVDFTGANLQRANLIGADLERACLRNADLTGARLNGINLTSADLSSAVLTGADIEFGILAGAVLARAILRDADLSGVGLEDADLRNADLRATNLRGADFRNARLDGATLGGSRLGDASFLGATLRGADLRDAYLRRARFDGADLASADLRRTRGLTEAQVRVAVCDAGTRLPDTIGKGAQDGE